LRFRRDSRCQRDPQGWSQSNPRPSSLRRLKMKNSMRTRRPELHKG
jgi:hypothetical protein